METHTHTYTNTHLLKSHINHSEREKGAPGLVWRAGKKKSFLTIHGYRKMAEHKRAAWLAAAAAAGDGGGS